MYLIPIDQVIGLLVTSLAAKWFSMIAFFITHFHSRSKLLLCPITLMEIIDMEITRPQA